MILNSICLPNRKISLKRLNNRLSEISEGLFFCFGTHILKTNVGSELVSSFIFGIFGNVGVGVHISPKVFYVPVLLDFWITSSVSHKRKR